MYWGLGVRMCWGLGVTVEGNTWRSSTRAEDASSRASLRERASSASYSAFGFEGVCFGVWGLRCRLWSLMGFNLGWD